MLCWNEKYPFNLHKKKLVTFVEFFIFGQMKILLTSVSPLSKLQLVYFQELLDQSSHLIA
jgi:hypothetical protein